MFETLKNAANFIGSLYADPSIPLRVREVCRQKEASLLQAIDGFSVPAVSSKPTKEPKASKAIETKESENE